MSRLMDTLPGWMKMMERRLVAVERRRGGKGGGAASFCQAVLSADVGANEGTWTQVTTWTANLNVGGFTVAPDGISVPVEAVYRVDLDIFVTTQVNTNEQWAAARVSHNAGGAGTVIAEARTGEWTPWTTGGAQGASLHLSRKVLLPASEQVVVEFYGDRRTTGTNTWVVPHPGSGVVGAELVALGIERIG